MARQAASYRDRRVLLAGDAAHVHFPVGWQGLQTPRRDTWSMASANLDLVRSIFADWERGDPSRADWADREIDLVVADGPTPGRAHGIPGMARAMREFLTAWEGWRTQAEEYREVDNERILVLTRESARGKTSGVDTRKMRANVFHLRGGKVTRLVIYWDCERALADLGLTPEAEATD